MNFLFKPLLFLSFFNFLTPMFGQYFPIPLDYKIENSEMIIEGNVIAQKSYYGTDDRIYTENIIKIEQVFKGSIPDSVIAIITLGGTINDNSEFWSHLLSLNLNEYGTFFLNRTQKQLNPTSKFRAFDVFSGSQGFYHFKKREINYEANATLDKHKNLNDFYAKIGVPENKRTYHFTQFAGVNADSCLIYKIEPVIPGLTLKENTSVDFNIYVKVKSGEFKLNQSELYLQYSTEWFYEDMVSNDYLTFSQGEFNSSNYELSISDFDNDILHFNLQALTSDYDDLESVSDTFKIIASVSIELKSISDEIPIQEDFGISDITNNHRTDEGYIRDFSCVKVEEGGNCGMKITSITPLAAAGVGLQSENNITGVIEIIGENFLIDEPTIECNKPIEHHVRFTTIDEEWIIPLEGDYIEYTNTKIRVKVPTVGYKRDCETLYSENDLNDAVACTGQVQVCKPGFFGSCCGCRVTSDDELYIPFAARNEIKTKDDGCKESIKWHLRDMHQGGYTWQFDPSFSNLAGAVDAFKRAVSTWRCCTQVNFKVDEVNLPSSTGNGFGKVTLENLSVGTRGATRISKRGSCSGIDMSYPITFEMAFNSNMMQWHTGTNMPGNLNWNNPANGKLEGDMESTALHELGHAHLLLHTCNEPNVMVRPGPNDFRRNLTSDDKDGGEHESLLGSNKGNCSVKMKLIDLGDCNLSPIIEINGQLTEVKVFPNPTQEKVFIEFERFFNPFQSTIQFLNLKGEIVLTKALGKNQNSLSVDIGNLSSGVYFLRFVTKNKQNFLIHKITKI